MSRWTIALALLLGLAGCSDNELGFEKRKPNRAPETTLASGPPDSCGSVDTCEQTGGTVYKVRLFWSGSDRDGTIDHFDYILVDHDPVRSHIDGQPDDTDPTRVVVEVPEVDDPRWIGTTATDSTFVTLADTLRRSPQPGPGENAETVRTTPFERWHTFFVRAVDNEGLPDPTPDYRSFNSRNVAPLVHLEDPIKAGAEFPGPPVIVFNWDGLDEVGDGTFREPVASRYVIIPSRINLTRDPSYVAFPDSLYALSPLPCPQAPRGCWSEWRRWDAADESGKTAVVSGLVRVNEAGPGTGYYIFAVQAMDEGGAVTPVFDYSTGEKNNVAFVRVTGSIGPILTVSEEFLGTYTFVGGSQPVRIDVAAGQPLLFKWKADASHYGGRIVAYRYAWDIRNPDNPMEWTRNWGSTVTKSDTRSFTTGSHRFFLEVRDNAETVTAAQFELTVHTVTRTRDLLWVDDMRFQVSGETEDDARWFKVLTQLSQENGFAFDPVRDVFDVYENRREAPPIGLLFDYKVVVWANRSSEDRSSALRNLALFYDPIVPRNQNTAKSFNYVNLYLANGGKLWINGYRPARQLWPLEREIGHEFDPVNVTNWDDPPHLTPHPPGIDSVGTISLLYKMGVEMFDVGAGVDSPRSSLPHYCQGFSRATPQGYERQTSESSEALDHTHLLDVLTQDVETPPPGGRTYETNVERDHKHVVQLTQADFVELRRGSRVSVESSASAVPDPDNPHSHVFELVDLVGLWGTPALATGSGWSQPPSQPAGLHGRSQIEIYNMPNEMAKQQPPLVPLAGISVVVYNYVSGVPENPDTGLVYDLTADRQPVFLLAKGSVLDPYYRRAFCGFEPYLLEEGSHKRLAEFVLVRHFRLGQVAD